MAGPNDPYGLLQGQTQSTQQPAQPAGAPAPAADPYGLTGAQPATTPQQPALAPAGSPYDVHNQIAQRMNQPGENITIPGHPVYDAITGKEKMYQLPRETNLLNPLGKYERPQPEPGTTNDVSIPGFVQNATRSAQAGLHGMASLEAAVLGRLSEAVPSVLPKSAANWQSTENPYRRGLQDAVPIPGTDKALDMNLQFPVRAEDVGHLSQVPTSMWNEAARKYIAPLAHGDIAGLGLNMYRDPGATIQDAMALIPGSGEMTGAALKAIPKMTGALAESLIAKIPEVHGARAAGKMLDATLDKEIEGTGITLRTHMMRAEQRLMHAYNDVPDKIKPYLTVIAENTDPALQIAGKTAREWRNDPAVATYLQLQDELNEPLWLRGVAEGHFGELDFLGTRVFPQYAAKVARGELPAPGKFKNKVKLATKDFYDDPAVQEAVRNYAADEIDLWKKSGGTHPFAGAYNTVATQHAVATYWGNRARNAAVTTSREAAVAQRQAAGITQTGLGTKRKVWMMGDQRRSLDTPRAALMKMEQTAVFFSMLDHLEGMQAVIDALPEAERDAARRVLAGRIEQIAGRIGVDVDQLKKAAGKAWDQLKTGEGPTAIEQIQTYMRDGQLPESLGAVSRALHSLDTVRNALGATGHFIGNTIGGPQRAVVVMTDLVMPFYIAIQQYAFFSATALRGPESIFNALLAAKIAMRQGMGRLENILPYQWLEHHSQQSGNGFVRLLARYQGIATTAVNQVRATHALQAMIDNLNRVSAPERGAVKRALRGQLKAAARLERFLQGKGSLGMADSVYREVEDSITNTLNNVYGKYTGAPSGLAAAAQGSGILFGRVLSHALTLAAHVTVHNPKKVYLLRAVSNVAGQYQQEAAQNFPDLREDIKEHGGWVLHRLAPDGSYVVQGTGGWNLLEVALRMPVQGLNAGRFLQKKLFGIVDENDTEEQIEVMPLNFLLGAALIFSGSTPNAQRPIMNPYWYTPNEHSKPYDVSLVNTHQLDTRKAVQPYPWSYGQATSSREFVAQGMTMMFAGFDNKLWSYQKFLTGQFAGIRPSDKTTPIPGMLYPKVNLKTGKMEEPAAAYPSQFIPGGNKLAPYTVRGVSQAERSAKARAAAPERIRRKEKAPQAEVIRRGLSLEQLQNTNRSKF